VLIFVLISRKRQRERDRDKERERRRREKREERREREERARPANRRCGGADEVLPSFRWVAYGDADADACGCWRGGDGWV
jgi:hypothetical protein